MRAITYQILIALVREIIELIMPKVSAHIRELLSRYLNDLYDRACETSNVFDDYFIEFIALILNIPLNKKTEGGTGEIN
jgi:hypothetical protein